MRSGKELTAGKTLTIPGKGGKKAPGKAAPEPEVAAAPVGTPYVVKPGDTLMSISQHYNMDPKQLQASNKMASDKLRPGDKLTVPGSAKPQPASPVASREPGPVGKAAPAASPAPQKTFAQAPSAPPAKQAADAKMPAQAKSQAPAAKPAAAKAMNYKVEPGETLWGIAKKFNVEPASLMAWNNMKSAGSLQAGSQLTIHKD